ncbi:crossover junction endodeoxyribonuclease RuvC [bacterium]|nr:crossover junction endodeoxyribonuclease RuvC [bacterium]
MIIFGIDPGTATTGFGVIELAADRTIKTLDYGIISTPKEEHMPARLDMLYGDLRQLLNQYQPAAVAIEQLFFARNVTTAISVGQARGVAILACEQQHIPIAEYTPLQVKQAVTGFGKAEKKQVQKMVQTILTLKSVPKPDDAADALAIAIAHSATLKLKN